MKFLFQTILVILLIFIAFVFYKNYFLDKTVSEENKSGNKKITNEKTLPDKQSNIIKNLKYNVELSESGKYEINSDTSEIIIKNETEIVVMKKVTAVFTDKNGKKLYINSDYAEFNSINYNTMFRDNILIKYEDNTITSNNLDFNFVKNYILVYENVIYKGLETKISTDNIKIDLVTKNIEIFMNNNNKNIKALLF